jgi:putative ABC transport system ATP-binding protein
MAKVEVLSLLKFAANEFGVTLILVTHDLHVAEQADRIITIEDGKIVADSKQEA